MTHFEELRDLCRALRPVLYFAGVVLLLLIGRVLAVGLVNGLWTP